jgi:acetyl esterase/lipase
MSVWLAESADPSPVVMFFYAGGFRIGKRRPPRPTTAESSNRAPASEGVAPLRVKQEIMRLLGAGISIVAPAHRRPDTDPAPAPFHDAARAVQYVRSQASDWNVDSDRIAATGASSGACLSLWLACHGEMAKPRAKDPVARQSTRLACVAGNSAVTSVDPRFIAELMPGSDAIRQFEQLLDYDADELESLPESKLRLMEELSPIHHVRGDAPPALLRYDRDLDGPYGIHHALFGQAFKERMDAVGARCDVIAGGRPIGKSQRASIPAFLKAHLLAPKS